MFTSKSMFDKKNFKYILVLTALAWLTYTLPGVRAAFESASAFDEANTRVAASVVSVAHAQTIACPSSFSVNLGVGSTGAEVVALQTFLISKGFSLSSITSGQKAKGIYDEETAIAVVKYQQSKGLPPSGYFGPLTRASANAECSKGTVVSATYPGTVNVITRLGGWPVTSSQTKSCVSTVTGPNGSNTAGCVRTLTNQPAGTYTIKWQGGYPTGADTTKVPAVSPVRFLGDRPAGENPITFYIDFASSTGTVATSSVPMISIISRLNGRVLSANEIPITCNVSLSTPKGIYPGPCSRTVTSSGVGTYAVRWSGSFPTGADVTKRPTVTGAQTLGTSNLIFYVDFAATPVVQPTLGIALVSANTSVSSGTQSNDDVGTFQIKYKIAGVGGDVYIPSNISSALNYVVDRSGVPVNSSVIGATLTNDTDSTVTTMGNYVVEDGTQETFTLTVVIKLNSTYTAGMYRTSLTGIKWGTADDMIPENTYANLDGFKTSYTALNLEDVQNPVKKSAFTASLLDALKTYVFGFGF